VTITEFKAIVERICGPAKWQEPDHWEGSRDRIKFRTDTHLSIKVLTALSEALGTDEINFNFGDSGSPGYSEMTPGIPGNPGWVEVMWPIKEPEPAGVKMGPDFEP
jgi:hypothetical protein